SGGGSSIKGLPDFLSNSLGLEVVLWHPLENLVSREIPGFQEAIGALNLAAGLALKGIERNVIGDLYNKMGIALLS
ncbi:MAG: hypothetical protein ACPL7L_02665, partial [bacterium]